MRWLFRCICLVLLLACHPAYGQDLESLLQGFEDTSIGSEASEPSQPADKESQFGATTGIWGTVWTRSGVNYQQKSPATGQYDFRGLSELTLGVDFHLEQTFSDTWKARLAFQGSHDLIFVLDSSEGATDEYRDDLESQFILRECWLAGQLANVSVKFGSQIMTWGSSDTLRVVDIVNPLDLRRPGFVDIAELRLPVFMTRLDGRLTPGLSWTAAVGHESKVDWMPAWGSDFYPFGQARLPENKPDTSLGNQEFFGRIGYSGHQWDASLHLAEHFANRARPAFDASRPDVPMLQHDRIFTVGAAATAVWKDWLYKAELAYHSGLGHFATSDQEFDRVDYLVGIEYSGFAETRLSLDAVRRTTLAYKPFLAAAPDNLQEHEDEVAFRIQRNFLRNSLHGSLLLVRWDFQLDASGYDRLALDYDINDDWNITASWTQYHRGGNVIFDRYANNDRLSFRLSRAF